MYTSQTQRASRSGRSVAGTGLLAGLLLLTLVAPAVTQAHPLGNFTFNRYDALDIAADQVRVDHVADLAEIPAFQERQNMDTDADGKVAPAEGAMWAEATCRQTADQLELELAGARLPLRPTAVGLSFPPGQGGLVTLRLVCTYTAPMPQLAGATPLAFRDRMYADRPGWREIQVRGSGVTLDGAEGIPADTTNRLTTYPPAEVSTPRDQRDLTITLTPGGPATTPPAIPDAVAIGSPPDKIVGAGIGSGVVPGGIAALPTELASVIQAQDLTLPAILLSLLVAAGVGAVHAVSPGHGKTLMAAYLVGTRGTFRHAVALGLTVTVSHTIGVLALGLIILYAGSVIEPERLFPILGLASGLMIIVIGAMLLLQRVRERREQERFAALAPDHDHGHDHATDHDHASDGGHHHDHATDHDHDHAQLPPVDAQKRDTQPVGWHSHGLVSHTHLPPTDGPLRWRNLFALGLVGGLVPSASAILILVGSIAAGRPAYGMVLTVAFGVGMAIVLVGVGVLLVRARGLIDRWPRTSRLSALGAQMPLVTAVIFVVAGTIVTVQSGLQLR